MIQEAPKERGGKCRISPAKVADILQPLGDTESSAYDPVAQQACVRCLPDTLPCDQVKDYTPSPYYLSLASRLSLIIVHPQSDLRTSEAGTVINQRPLFYSIGT